MPEPMISTSYSDFMSSSVVDDDVVDDDAA